MKKIFSILLNIILLLGFLLHTSCSINGVGTALPIDNPAPDFSLSDLSGQKVSLDDFRGKTIVINFWATTCGPCVNEMPVLEEFSNSLSGTEIVFLSINIGEDINTVKDFIQSYHYTFPVLLDSQYEVAGKYNVRYIPNSYFVDKEGLVKVNMVGPFKNKMSIEKQLASFLP
jgi:peroxiredoxin